ncbi:TPA: oxalurate catabolism protein HpxX [Yersinia enterocolitica]
MKETSEKNAMDWAAYIQQMEILLALELDDTRRAALLQQFERIATMAGPLMALPLDEKQEIAGVYRL